MNHGLNRLCLFARVSQNVAKCRETFQRKSGFRIISGLCSASKSITSSIDCFHFLQSATESRNYHAKKVFIVSLQNVAEVYKASSSERGFLQRLFSSLILSTAIKKSSILTKNSNGDNNKFIYSRLV